MERALTGQRKGQPLSRLQIEMNDLLNRFFSYSDLFWPEACWPERTAFSPAIDLAENETEIVVRAEVPGCEPDEINIAVQDHMMTIKGERKGSSEEKKENYYHMERRQGSFRRDINLPAEINADKIEAKCRDGVLTITMPKSEKAQAQRIIVQT